MIFFDAANRFFLQHMGSPPQKKIAMRLSIIITTMLTHSVGRQQAPFTYWSICLTFFFSQATLRLTRPHSADILKDFFADKMKSQCHLNFNFNQHCFFWADQCYIHCPLSSLCTLMTIHAYTSQPTPFLFSSQGQKQIYRIDTINYLEEGTSS